MSEPIRIAQVLNRMDSGGIEAVVMNYYRAIDRDRIQFDFFLDGNSVFPQREELERLGAGIFLIPPYTHALSYQKTLRRLFRQRGYKIVHAHLSTMSVFALLAAKRAGVPVRICHNHSTAHRGEGGKTLLKYVLRPFCRLYSSELFACGDRAARWMYGDRAVEAGDVRIIRNAIDTERYAFDGEARQRLRCELGIPDNAYVVGHIGRFMYQKNHDFLIRMFARLAEVDDKAVLLLIGEGELEDDMKSLADELGLGKRVIFTGARRDADKLYSAMDIFCLPSFYEGMPLVAWEAQANGLPCAFSSTVTGEAACGEGCTYLDTGSAEEWVSLIAAHPERCAASVPDIGEAAHRLEEYYTAKLAELK